jgi:hypothetical protein
VVNYTTIINELFSLDNHTEYDSLDTCIDDAVLESMIYSHRLVRGLDAQPKKLRKVEDYRPIAYVILNSSEVRKDDRKENQSGWPPCLIAAGRLNDMCEAHIRS